LLSWLVLHRDDTTKMAGSAAALHRTVTHWHSAMHNHFASIHSEYRVVMA
jgi:hypothetical protein